MNTRERKGLFGAWGLAVVALAGLVLVSAAACKSEKPAPPKVKKELSLGVLTPVFGVARDANSGLADFTQSDEEIILSYHLYLTDRTNADREIARDLAPKIRSLLRALRGRRPGELRGVLAGPELSRRLEALRIVRPDPQDRQGGGLVRAPRHRPPQGRDRCQEDGLRREP